MNASASPQAWWRGRDRPRGVLAAAAIVAAAGLFAVATVACSPTAPEGPPPPPAVPTPVALDDGLVGAWHYARARDAAANAAASAALDLSGQVRQQVLAFAGGACQVQAVYVPPPGTDATAPPPTRPGVVRDQARDVLGWQLRAAGRYRIHQGTLTLSFGSVTIAIDARIMRLPDGSMTLTLSEDPLFPALGATTWTRAAPAH